MRLKFLFLKTVFLLSVIFSYAQESLLLRSASTKEKLCKKYQKLQCPEKWWIIFHPFVAGKALKISEEAIAITEKIKGDSLLGTDIVGGRLDAFKHAYWMARMSQVMNWKKAIKLGDAHEKGNERKNRSHTRKKGNEVLPAVCHDSVGSAMDRWNNWIGIAIGKQNFRVTPDRLTILIRNAVSGGILKIVRKNKNGESLDANGNVIPETEWNCKWLNRRCLVGANL